MSFTAGAILYVGASHLLPEVEHARNRYSVLAMAAGVVVAVVVVLLRG